jgi:hypothetical protein
MILRRLCVLAIVVASFSAFAAPSGVPTFPAGAYAVEDYTVAGSETMQASFQVDSQYPQSQIIDHYTANVAPEWAACEGANHGWQAYVDKSGGTPKLVHQHIRYWVNFEQSKMLTVVVRHITKSDAVQCLPDSDVQHGVLLVSRSPELKKEIRLLKLLCDTRASSLRSIPQLPTCSVE